MLQTLPTITETCWNWCKEQHFINQSNLDISNLAIVGVAMLVLLLYNISIEWSDKICENFNVDKEQLISYGHILVFLAFILLALFLGYYAFSK